MWNGGGPLSSAGIWTEGLADSNVQSTIPEVRRHSRSLMLETSYESNMRNDPISKAPEDQPGELDVFRYFLVIFFQSLSSGLKSAVWSNKYYM
jgi:hypothetical protein